MTYPWQYNFWQATLEVFILKLQNVVYFIFKPWKETLPETLPVGKQECSSSRLGCAYTFLLQRPRSDITAKLAFILVAFSGLWETAFFLKRLLARSFWLSGHRVPPGEGVAVEEERGQPDRLATGSWRSMHLNKPHVVFSQAPECLDFISTENRERKTKITSACFRKQSYLVVCGQRACSDALESMIVNKPIQGLSLHMLLTGAMYSQEGLSFTN